MGGGDLNTKKSWHPNTLKNQERVWKAEQAAANEQRRIKDLQSEIKNERSREEIKSFGESTGVLQRDPDAKLDWMYKHPDKSVNAEEYLLGKSIDKNYENKIAQEKLEEKGASKNHVEHDCIPFSIRNLRGQNSVGQEAQVDLARKMQEDPLLAIRKREMESRAQMLQNPLKLMELKRLLVQDQKKRNIHKLAKKSKKNKEDLDALLAKKLKKIQSSEQPIDLENLLSQKSSKKKNRNKKEAISDSDSDHHSKKSNKKKNKHRKKDYTDKSEHHTVEKVKHRETKGRKKEESSSDNESDYQNISAKNNKDRNEKKQQKFKSPSSHKSKYQRDHQASAEKLGYKRQKERVRHETKPYIPEKEVSSDRNIDRKEYRRRRSGSEEEHSMKKRIIDSIGNKSKQSDRDRWPEKSNHLNQYPKKKDVMTGEEKERKRKEMMENASERNLQRSSGLARRHEEENQHYDPTFIHKQLRQAANSGSLQDRIRSNVNNIQRSNRSMDVNFARR